MSKNLNRRDFLAVSATGVAGASAAAAQTVTQGSIKGRPARIGFVGVGDRGSYHLDIALGIDGVEIPAICDINPHYLHRANRCSDSLIRRVEPADKDVHDESYSHLVWFLVLGSGIHL